MKINDVVFTNHSIDRLKERGITGEMVWNTVRFSDINHPGKQKHTTEFIKKIGDKKVTSICKKNEIGEWVVLSAWIDPPLYGTNDYKNRQKYTNDIEKDKKYNKKMEKASFWGKIWLTFKKQADF